MEDYSWTKEDFMKATMWLHAAASMLPDVMYNDPRYTILTAIMDDAFQHFVLDQEEENGKTDQEG